MKLSRTAFAGMAAVAALASGGIAYAASSTPTASKTDTIATTTTAVHLGATGGVLTTVATLNLPPGAYVLRGSGDLVNFGPSDYTRCQLFAASTHIAGVSTLVGNPDASGAWGAAGILSPFSLVGGVVNPGPGSIVATLRCSHDHSNGATPYIDPDATLWAHKTRGLKLVRE
jgi:hypothetical protein